VLRQAHLREQRFDARRVLGLRNAARFERERHVAGDRAPRQEGASVVLEDDSELCLRPVHLGAFEQRAAGGDGGQAGEGAQERGLAAARGADEADELVLLHGEAHVAQDRLRAVDDA